MSWGVRTALSGINPALRERLPLYASVTLLLFELRLFKGWTLTDCLAEGEGRSIWLLGDLYTFKLTVEALAVTELTAFPKNGPAPHIHLREDQSFWVLDSEFAVLL